MARQGRGLIVILTGAGISKESGLDTFRDKDGLWTKVNLEEVATGEALRRNPERVLEFYNRRRRQLSEGGVAPNAAHLALARLEASGVPVALVTQNVDDLHERAGSGDVLHMHGRLMGALCGCCGASGDWPGDVTLKSACPSCGREGAMRPDIVLFGERPYHLEEIAGLLAECALFVSIGTSGTVYPAAGYLGRAARAGVRALELNMVPTVPAGGPVEGRYGPATEVVPAWVGEVLAGKW
ncbi:MAG: NAD-dependent deacylase [Deltaproteobacteria bacterium]|nr:NAD-dependent deacylase [Deltaproteobacteria bacterium]